jgi:hypothetical protein
MTLPVTTAREQWYGIGGYPTVKIDGLITEEGGSATPPPAGCVAMANTYRTDINNRIASTGGVSPIEITGTFSATGSSDIWVGAKFKLVDPVTLTNLRATLVVYEDNVIWCCGYGGEDTWQHNTRAIYDENITLTSVGDEVTVSASLPMNAAWNRDEMHAVAYVQKTTGTKEIYQGAMLERIYDFSIVYDHKMCSIPFGNGTADFNAVLTNTSAAVDTVTLEVATQFGDWPTVFFIGSDPTPHSDPLDVILSPAETRNVKVRVSTNSTKEVRTGVFQASSARTSRVDQKTLRIFNGGYAILLVDDDFIYAYEVPLENALNSLGALYDNWDIRMEHADASPTLADMQGFDMVIWQTGWRTDSPLTQADMNALMAYMDGGGRLFLTSQSFLNYQTTLGPFATNYLGVASKTLDVAYVQMDGVAGDPIGDGLSLPLTYASPLYKKGDNAVPGPTAATVFLAPDGSHTTIRNTMLSGTKSVFMAVAFNTISESAADPNNAKTVLDRILAWLSPVNPADVEDGQGSTLASRISGIWPNPSDQRTEISFALSAAGASGPVRLEIFDLSGRRVAGLVDGSLPPGAHARVWNGTNDAGRAVGSGAYFARLLTREGIHSEKLILVR